MASTPSGAVCFARHTHAAPRAMQQNVVNYRRPGTASAARAAVRSAIVSRRDEGAICICIRYPDALRKDLTIGLILCGVLAIAIPCVAFWVGGWRMGVFAHPRCLRRA
jgi:hypothetical protein